MKKNSSNIKLELSDSERKNLRGHKIKKSEILEYSPDELENLIQVSPQRAKEIYAFADFQRVPSIGIEFAKDLTFLGFYSVAELKSKNGANLLDEYEKKKGYSVDPCVEDQFRLMVDFAENENYTKKWWDFTPLRKSYRDKMGYPKDRPSPHIY